MIIDAHVHLPGGDSPGHPNLWRRDACPAWVLRPLARSLGVSPAEIHAPGTGRRVAERLCAWLAESRLDAAVFLALDGVYRPDGSFDHDRTRVQVSNEFVADVVAGCPKARFGASVHPWSRDAEARLERLAARGACLVKWLPSVQHIQPDHPQCFPFYRALARLGLPLLCHTGHEHALRGGSQAWNRPRLLVPALDHGVTVIAAHCGTSLFLYDRSYFDEWAGLARAYPSCHGDISAFGSPLRARALRRALADPRLARQLVYGSDIPVMFVAASFLPWLGLRRYLRLRRQTNPFDRVLDTLQAAGVPDAVLTRGAKLLRLAALRPGSP